MIKRLLSFVSIASLLGGLFIFSAPKTPVAHASGGFVETAALSLVGEENLTSSVIDTANGFAYFGTYTSPGKIVKVRLSDNTKVGTIILNDGENLLTNAVIDTANGFAYFGTETSPGKIVKIRLSDFTRVGAVTASTGEDMFESSVIDPSGGFAYFGTYTAPAKIVKINLSSFTRVGVLAADTGEDHANTGVIDVAGGYAYFGLDTPGTVMKVKLSDFSNESSLVISTGRVAYSAIDPSGGFAYFVGGNVNDNISKVRLSDFTEVDTYSYGNGRYYTNPAIDTLHGFLYVALYGNPFDVVKIDLTTFTDTGTLFTSNFGESVAVSAVIDPSGGFAYFGTQAPPGQVVKVDLSSFTETSTLTLESSPSNLGLGSVIDPANGFAYVGTTTSPAQIVKVRLSDFSRIDTIATAPGEDNLGGGVIDQANGFAYFFTETDPVIAVKVRLSDFTEVESVTLGVSSDGTGSAVIDPVSGYAYVGTLGGEIIKIDINPSHAFQEVDRLTLTGDEATSLDSGAIDLANGLAYFATNTSPTSQLVRIDVNPAHAFTRLEALTLDNVGVPDPLPEIVDGFLYVGTYDTPSQVLKVDVDPLHTFAETDRITFADGEDNAVSSVIDAAHGFAYFGTRTAPAQVIKVNLSTFGEADSITLADGENNAEVLLLDPIAGFVYAGLGTTPGVVSKISTGDSGPFFTVPVNADPAHPDATQQALISATAVDDVGVNQIKLFLDGTSDPANVIKTCTFNPAQSPATCSITIGPNIADGDHTIRAVARDTTSQTTISDGGFNVGSFTSAGNMTFSRLKAGLFAVDFGLTFQVVGTDTDPVTVTFPAGFNVEQEFTSGTCSGGGTVGSFEITSSTVITGQKTGCSGTVTLTGALIDLPGTPGEYVIRWANDSGSGTVSIVDDDSVTLTANVDPSITFDIDTAVADVNSAAPYTLNLGVLTPSAVASSGTAFKSIWIDLSTNASHGAVVTVKNLNGANGLVSSSAPSDKIPNAAASMSAGTANYGLCVISVAQTQGTLQKVSPYDTGTCTADGTTNAVKALTTSDAPILDTNDAPIDAARARISVNAAVSAVTPGHADYADTVTLIATGTY